jgi:hypothetical protein
MTHTRRTLLLDGNWDVTLNGAGGLALAEGAYATAQNVANECRRFTRDSYFDFDAGVPHFMLELGGRTPPRPLLRTYLRRAAMRVADVREVTGIETEGLDRESRTLGGAVWFVTEEGEDAGTEL